MKGILTIFVVAAAAAVSINAQTPSSPNPRVERRVETRVLAPEGGPVGYIGVELRDVNMDNFAQYGLGEVRGTAVDRVVEDSPAAKAGIRKGDVIVRFDGESVTSARKLQRLVSEVAPDHQAKITVVRGGKETDMSIVVGRREASMTEGSFILEGMPDIPFPNVQIMPDGQGEYRLRIPRNGEMPGKDGGTVEGRVVVREGGRRIGIGVSPLTKQLGDYFGVTDGRGLLINEVRENSPAAKVGMKAGDVVVAIDGKPVGETPELIEAINAKKDGDVTLTLVRNKRKETVKVTPEPTSDDERERRIERVIINGPIGG